MAKNEIVLQKGDIIEYKKYFEQGNNFAIVEKPKYASRAIGETLVRELDKLGVLYKTKKLSNVATGTVVLRHTQIQLKQQFGFDFSDIDNYVKAGFVRADSYSYRDNGECFLKQNFWKTSRQGEDVLVELKKIKRQYDNRFWAYGIDPETQQNLYFESSGIVFGEKYTNKITNKDKSIVFYENKDKNIAFNENAIEAYVMIEKQIKAVATLKNELIEFLGDNLQSFDATLRVVVINEFMLDNIRLDLLDYAEINKTPDQQSLNLYLQFKENAEKALMA